MNLFKNQFRDYFMHTFFNFGCSQKNLIECFSEKLPFWNCLIQKQCFLISDFGTNVLILVSIILKNTSFWNIIVKMDKSIWNIFVEKRPFWFYRFKILKIGKINFSKLFFIFNWTGISVYQILVTVMLMTNYAGDFMMVSVVRCWW